MKKRKYNGDIVEVPGQPRRRFVTVRLTGEEYQKLEVLKTRYNYSSTSAFLRDLLFKKRIDSKKIVVRLTDKTLRDKINSITFQIKKIGTNYNQVVTLYHTQAKMTRPDGTPWLNTRRLDSSLERLMVMTEKLRDELAVLIDVVERFTMENT